MLKFAICGYSGKMGQEIDNLSCQNRSNNEFSSKFEFALAIDKKNSLRKNEEFMQSKEIPLVAIESLTKKTLQNIDGIIDFSHKESTLHLIDKLNTLSLKPSFSLVIGTTGFTNTEEKKIKIFSTKYSVFKSSNMSVGINAFSILVKLLTKILEPLNFDKEVLEIHHKDKEDAPSGTSILLQEAIQDASSSKINFIHSRKGMVGKRKNNESGSFSIRGGDVVGDHSVYFLGNGERIELKHQVHSRRIFAQGALTALKYLHDKGSGLYSMKDLLSKK